MRTFATMGDVAAYLKEQEPGTRVIMTEGPKKAPRKVRQELRQRGVRVNITGEYGNRIVTFVGVETHTPERQKRYKASQNDDENLSFGAQKQKIIDSEDGAPVFIKGNNTTIIRGLRKMGYKGRYSVNKHNDGWLISVKSENSSIRRFNVAKELMDYLAGSPIGTKALLIGVGLRTKERFHRQFAERGMNAKIEDAPGGLHFNYESKIPGYRPPDDPTFLKNCRDKLIEDAPPIYVEGSRPHLITMLVKWGYKGKFSMCQKDNGWLVSVKSKAKA